MSNITIALAVPHAAHETERQATMQRLRLALGISGPYGVRRPEIDGIEHYREFTRKCHHSEWSAELWHWQLGTGASHCLTLQDDIMPSPVFWPALRAMVEAVPDQVISLQTTHPAAREAARRRNRWITTSDGLTGPQYLTPRAMHEEFLVWCANNLRPDARWWMPEDALLNCFLLDTGRRAWHPVPAIARHDTKAESTGILRPGETPRADQMFRDVSVAWTDGDVGEWNLDDLTKIEFWRPTRHVPHFGMQYGGTHALARQWVTTFSDVKYARCKKDRPPPHIARELVPPMPVMG